MRGGGMRARKKGGTQSTTRDRILDAASRIVAKHGVPAATTKRIAAEARLSEGSLYNHFKDKPELLIALVLERLPGIKQVFIELQKADVALPERITAALVALIAFYRQAQPFVAGMLSDPDLLKLCRRRFIESGQGPHLAHEKLADILRAEQMRGHIRKDANPEMLAALLIGACTEWAALNAMTGKSPGGLADEPYGQAIVAALAPAMFPDERPRSARPRQAAD
jgi:AcrR family transcriptional regulator